MSGALITFEGVEGSGKTTQMLRLERWLRAKGYRVERTREPEGTRLGTAVRRLFERQTLAFHRRVRRGYLEILRAEPKRVRLIRAALPPDEVTRQVRTVVEEFLRGA